MHNHLRKIHKSFLNPNFTQIFAFFELLCQNIIINSVRVCQYFLFIITPRPRTLKESEKKGREWNIKIIYYRTPTFITTLETQLASLMYTLCLFSPLLWRCLASFIFFLCCGDEWKVRRDKEYEHEARVHLLKLSHSVEWRFALSFVYEY